MQYIDVFNGDADGIFSLVQWRQAHPIAPSDKHTLITGVKRDIALVKTISTDMATDAVLTILDVSFDKNSDALKSLLDVAHSAFYCDHHKADTLFEHPKLRTRINTEPTVCTGLLINAELKDSAPLWAVAAAYGDGLDNIADRHIARLGLSEAQRDALRELGILVNYNGYGSSVADLHFDPAELYRQLVQYHNPFEVVADDGSAFGVLKAGYEADISKAQNSQNISHSDDLIAILLDDAAWARRISGTYGNQLAADNPDKPVVIVTRNNKGSYTISLRAPKNNPYGASTICSQFATGGGREGAAGVNELPIDALDAFLQAVRLHYQST